MRRLFVILLAVALVAAVALVWRFGPAFAGDAPLSGTWKVVVFPPDGVELGLWLVNVEHKGESPKAKIIATGLEDFKQSEVEQVAADGNSLHLKIKVESDDGSASIPIAVYLPEGEANPEVLRGYAQLRGDKHFVQLERTNLKKLDRDDAVGPGASDDFTRARRARTMKEAARIFTQIEKSHPGTPSAYYASLSLLNIKAHEGASADEVRAQAGAALKIAAAYGPEMKLDALTDISRQLNSTDKTAAIAAEYGRQAEHALSEKDPPNVALPVLKTLASALRKTGKAEEASKLQPRIEKLDEAMDQEYLKDAVPFKPTPFRGRKGESQHVVLVELFTGAQCPPCVAADVAFDALQKTYRPSEAVFLQYHLHAPAPDPLTNEDSEKRSDYYDAEGTPTLYVDGQAGPETIPGPKQAGKRAYTVIQKALNDALESETKVNLKLSARRQGDQINITADVSGLEKTGDKMRLRFVLIEDVVRYQGRNGQRLHHHVVRAFPGGADGMKLDKPASMHAVTVNVAELVKALDSYLTAANTKRPFLDDERPLDMKNLKVVALVQDDDSKKVLQAAQADVDASAK
jgi:hypothetical protein